MRTRAVRKTHRKSADDVGTLWTLQRGDLTARCALLSWRDAWEVTVLVEGKTLMSQRCVRTDEAFALAERCRRGLLAQSSQQVVPYAAGVS